jgi:hypothetical protein
MQKQAVGYLSTMPQTSQPQANKMFAYQHLVKIHKKKSICYRRTFLAPRTADCNTVTYQNTPQKLRKTSLHKYGSIAHLRHIMSSNNIQNVSELPSVLWKKFKDSRFLRHSVLFDSKLTTFRRIKMSPSSVPSSSTSLTVTYIRVPGNVLRRL